MQSNDDFKRNIGNALERALSSSNESRRLRRNWMLDNEKRSLRQLAKRARRMQQLGYSQKGIAAKLNVTVDDVWELLKETSE